MIPKIIHYCWFGQHDMPALNNACIETWTKHLPDYKFVRWDESNSPKNDFIIHHLNAGNWAFVADYVRLYALYKEGGIYLDTDFEVLKPFDPLLNHEGFLAYQDQEYVTNGIAGSVKGNVYYQDCMNYMDDRFVKNKPFHISPIVTTNVLNNKAYNMKVYSSDYFYPYNPYDDTKNISILMVNMISDNTYAIHHWAKSWEHEKSDEIIISAEILLLLKKIYKKTKQKLHLT